MKFLKIMSLAIALTVTSGANATVITGQLETLRDINGSITGNTIDHIEFTVNSDSNVTFNMLSWDAFANFFDTEIWLFSNDGSLDSADLITSNDDFPADILTGGADGSTNGLDSYISTFLTAGDYLLAVDSCCHSVEEVVQGFNSHAGQHMSGGEDFGTYQVTFGGDITLASVPEPASIALLGLGLAGIGFSRKKKAA